jgi:hypothetical protein
LQLVALFAQLVILIGGRIVLELLLLLGKRLLLGGQLV